MTNAPNYGETVELEILGEYIVRDPFDAHILKSGDRVVWSTYFERRRRDGALVPKTLTKKVRAPREPKGDI